MSWKTKIGMDQMHPSFTETIMDDHDLCECDRCHFRGDHDDLTKWKDECAACSKENVAADHENGDHENPLLTFTACKACYAALADTAAHATYEFTFSIGDVAAAQVWATRHRYQYEDVNHLLHDAMQAGAIRPRTWKAA